MFACGVAVVERWSGQLPCGESPEKRDDRSAAGPPEVVAHDGGGHGGVEGLGTAEPWDRDATRDARLHG
jgi:hypothetical protein